MTEPYNVDDEVSSLCATGLVPQQLTGIIMKLVTRKFSDANTIQHPLLKKYIWRPDVTQSQLFVAPNYRWDPQVAQQRPAVIIQRNSLQPVSIALGDSGTPTSAADPEYIPGARQMACSMQGSHTVFCMAPAPAQAEILSTELYVSLLHYNQMIRSELNMNRFRVMEIGNISRIEESDDHFAVPISVVYSWIESWQVVEESPALRRAMVSIDVE